jgi:hypothetical protein
MPEEPKVITPPVDENEKSTVEENVQQLVEWMKDKVRTKNKKGKFDVDIMLQNMVDNIGDGQINANGLLMQAQMQLADLERERAGKWGEMFEQLMSSRQPFEKTKDNVNMYLSGKKEIANLDLRIKKKMAYIDNLKGFADAVRYYPKNVQTILDLNALAVESGKQGLIDLTAENEDLL